MSEVAFAPVFDDGRPLTERSELYDDSRTLGAILKKARNEDDILAYLLVQAPILDEGEGEVVLDLAESLQRRLFMHATGVNTRSTVVGGGDEYHATLVVFEEGVELLTTLFGNDYKNADPRATERQAAQLYEAEVNLMAQNFADLVYAKQLAALPATDAGQPTPLPAQVYGSTTIYFPSSKRGHRSRLTS